MAGNAILGLWLLISFVSSASTHHKGPHNGENAASTHLRTLSVGGGHQETTRISAIPLRVAVIGLAGDASREAEVSLIGAMGRFGGIAVVERLMFEPALTAVGYNGSINMSTEEAQRVGSAIGCDFFIIGKSEVVARSDREREVHQEAIAGVMIVDGRTGSLAIFDFVTVTAASEREAKSLLARTIFDRAGSYVERILEYRRAKETPDSNRGRPVDDRLVSERVEEIPAEGSPQSVGFVAPEFLNRVKPEYSREAERANIRATVELKVVLRANGEIGPVEVVRWAGFGLDEAGIKAARGLKFKPATRGDQPISVRALIRYNFSIGSRI